MAGRLIFLRGLPGSGKTTWAKAQVEASAERHMDKTVYPVVRVNKDEIRIELGMNRKSYKREQEYAVVDRRDQRIAEALEAGRTVISDDTNFGKKHEPRLRALAAEYGADFEIKDFTDVPVEVCIERDLLREGDARVGEDVIWGMAEQYLGLQRPKPYEGNPSLPPAIICDLDGTLALFKGLRGPFEYDKAAKDRVNEPVYRIISLFFTNGYNVLYVSGREDWGRFATEDFLRTNNCPPGPLLMRKSGDYRQDAIIKREIFDAEIRDKYNVKFVLDDRDQVVKMWRELGLTCLQVAEGQF